MCYCSVLFLFKNALDKLENEQRKDENEDDISVAISHFVAIEPTPKM